MWHGDIKKVSDSDTPELLEFTILVYLEWELNLIEERNVYNTYKKQVRPGK